MENGPCFCFFKPATYIEKRKTPFFLFSDFRFKIGNRMNTYTDLFVFVCHIFIFVYLYLYIYKCVHIYKYHLDIYKLT